MEYPPPGTTTSDTVYYSPDRKLAWDDFKGTVRKESSSEAVTFTGFSYDATALKLKDSIFVHIYMQIYFDRIGSWVRQENKNAYALAHEQQHFDIAKIMADAFKDTLLSSTFSPEYYDSEIHFLYWDYWRKMTTMEQLFDDETHHGINQAKEAYWSEKVRKALLSNSNPD